MKTEDVIIIGAGPCGLSTAIELQKKGFSPLIIEKGNVVNAIYHYPTHQTFFSTSEKLEIGDMPFVIEGRKPKRNQALSYYREVVRRKKLRIKSFEEVRTVIKKDDKNFFVQTINRYDQQQEYQSKNIVIATGYYDHPNYLGIPGEELPKVSHYFKEAHPYFDCDVVVIGGKNSAIDSALELEKVGARVTVIYRGDDYSTSIKPWILPEFTALVKSEKIKMVFKGQVTEIKENSLVYISNGESYQLINDYVFAMIGYHPDHHFIKEMGVDIDDETGRPRFDPETMETNIKGIFISGVIAAGNNANEIFIENGRFHGQPIALEIAKRI